MGVKGLFLPYSNPFKKQGHKPPTNQQFSFPELHNNNFWKFRTLSNDDVKKPYLMPDI